MSEFCHQVSKACYFGWGCRMFHMLWLPQEMRDFRKEVPATEALMLHCLQCSKSLPIRCWYKRLPPFPPKAGEICFGGVLAACQVLRLISKAGVVFHEANTIRCNQELRDVKVVSPCCLWLKHSDAFRLARIAVLWVQSSLFEAMFSSFLTSILTFWALARSNGKGTCALTAETLLKTPKLIYLLLQRELGYLHISYIHGCFDEDDTKF